MTDKRGITSDVAGPLAGLVGFGIVCIILLVLILGGCDQTVFFIHNALGSCNSADLKSQSLARECRSDCITYVPKPRARRKCFSTCESEAADRGHEVMNCHGSH